MSPEPNASSSSAFAARTVDADDAALLRRVSAGDKAALAVLYREYHRRLVRFLGRFTRRDDVIEEVVNDTFMIVWQKAAEFRGRSRVSTWLMGIAYRVTLKALRQGGLPTEPLSSWPDGEPMAEPVAAHEVVDWLTKGMTRLAPEQRMVLELAYVMGHSLEEIAEIADCPISTVKARMFHARVKLRNLMPALAGLVDGEEQ
ncbi:MAG TPA: sigma-70 family RNA polymerase sigma factor [Paraburkholderia sp.]|uniref:RNA polymerase sigma factor n=1 Tax=Burkholderia pyrrocinia TaxID=60550 RepID=UPI000B690260|nr:RNA polymerase subunit sigma-70 [Burkholderia territorii]HDR9504213.1 sigma-70 family RNA polymerase sigma factor [Burkholderia cepacia]HKT97168.1 sigma-70 family RNA polymerase sigma factor [Paraburkholderia sp.]